MVFEWCANIDIAVYDGGNYFLLCLFSLPKFDLFYHRIDYSVTKTSWNVYI